MKSRIMAGVAVLLCVAAGAPGQSHHRKNNEALLGIVTVPAKKGVEIAHVLDRSPAKAAGLKAGDRLVAIAGHRIKSVLDVDHALEAATPGKKAEVSFVRGGKKMKKSAKLVARKRYKGKFLDRRGRGSTGFDAPEWFGFAWKNVGKKGPPTRKSTKGKVVVIHTFQSW